MNTNSITRFARKAEKLVTDNSPLLLTAIGVTGTITTAYLAARGGMRAQAILEDERVARSIRRKAGEPEIVLNRKEKFELVWKLYIPAVSTATFTCAAIVCANRIGTRRAAAVAAAYSVSEKAFVEYRDKVIEKIGEKQEKEVRDEIAQDRVRRMPPSNEVMITPTYDGQVLCLDTFSQRYFMSDMQTLRKAQNDINAQVLHSDSATVTDYYNAVGLEPTAISDEMGWNSDKMLELHFSSTLTEHKGSEVPCMVVDFATMPIREPWQFPGGFR